MKQVTWSRFIIFPAKKKLYFLFFFFILRRLRLLLHRSLHIIHEGVLLIFPRVELYILIGEIVRMLRAHTTPPPRNIITTNNSSLVIFIIYVLERNNNNSRRTIQ